MNKIKIISEPTAEKPFLIIWKPKNLPSAPLTQDDKENALSQAGQLYSDIYKVQGKKDIEYGLIHRIDTATDGLLLIATSQECYDFLMEEQKEGRFIKFYTALCNLDFQNPVNLEGFPVFNNESSSLSNLKENNTISINSYFRHFGKGSKEVRPVTEASGKAAMKKIGKAKLYTTEVSIKKIDEERKTCLVQCKIVEGYRHQVRCHLGWAGLPIVNDEIYNFNYRKDLDKKNAENEMKFSATKLQFEYPRGDLNSYEIALTWT